MRLVLRHNESGHRPRAHAHSEQRSRFLVKVREKFAANFRWILVAQLDVALVLLLLVALARLLNLDKALLDGLADAVPLRVSIDVDSGLHNQDFDFEV